MVKPKITQREPGATGDADNVLASTLAAAVYTDNVWMLQTLDQPAESIPTWRVAAMPEADSAQIERACLLKQSYKRMEGISLPASSRMADPMGGGALDCSYAGGVFFAGDLACAAVVERRLAGGKSVVELSFRGTEKETTGNPWRDRGNLIGGYFLSAYCDMPGHYERHRPLIDEVVREVNRRLDAGEDVELKVSGHSLGGSMAELFAKTDAPRLRDPSRATVITFGSPGMPGSGGPVSAFTMLALGMARALLAGLGFLETDARKVARSVRAEVPFEEGRARVRQYVDPNDPIPKIGRLGGMKPSGTVAYSRWSRDRDMRSGHVVPGSFLDVSWHSALLYEKEMGYLLDWRGHNEPRSIPSGVDMGLFARAKKDAEGVMARAAAEKATGLELGRSVSAIAERVDWEVRSMIVKGSPNWAADVAKRDEAVSGLFEMLPGKIALWKAGRKAREEASAEAAPVRPLAAAI